MYGIFTYIWLIFIVNVGIYTVPYMDPMAMLISCLLRYLILELDRIIFHPGNSAKKWPFFWGWWVQVTRTQWLSNDLQIKGLKGHVHWITRKMNQFLMMKFVQDLGAGAMGSLWSWNYECVFSTCWEKLTCLVRQFLECNERLARTRFELIIYWCRLRWTSKSCMW